MQTKYAKMTKAQLIDEINRREARWIRRWDRNEKANSKMLMHIYEELRNEHEAEKKAIQAEMIHPLRGYYDDDDEWKDPATNLLKEALKHVYRELRRMEYEQDAQWRRGSDTMHDGWYDYHGDMVAIRNSFSKAIDRLTYGDEED